MKTSRYDLLTIAITKRMDGMTTGKSLRGWINKFVTL